MEIDTWMVEATKKVKQAGIGTARLDALILLEDATGLDRAYLLAHPETVLSAAHAVKLDKQIKRRLAHEPLAYIRGKTEFYGREFFVDKRVLEPRSESETMIELLVTVLSGHSRGGGNLVKIADIGTGSGALGITAKLELPKAEVIAIDIDPACLAVGRQNAQKLNADITFLEGNLLTPLTTNYHQLLPTILLANLPYVPNSHTINQAAMNEPRLAIFGGEDGLDLYRELFKQIKNLSGKPLYILTESLPFQHEGLAKIAKKSGYKLLKTTDFIQAFKKT